MLIIIDITHLCQLNEIKVRDPDKLITPSSLILPHAEVYRYKLHTFFYELANLCIIKIFMYLQISEVVKIISVGSIIDQLLPNSSFNAVFIYI